MKLRSFRVQNYKTIEDSGLINCHDVTAFVGKNEAGKTSLLRALSKLKPTDGEGYDGLREFPRKRYTDDFKKTDWEVVTATFELEAVETAEIAKITPLLLGVKEVRVTRRYSGDYSVAFAPNPEGSSVSQEAWTSTLKNAIAAVEGIFAKMQDGWTPEQQQEAKNQWAACQSAIKHHLQTEINNLTPPDQGRATGTRDLIIHAPVNSTR